MALIIDDGSKRNRKQVQAFDPLRDEAEAEQKRIDLIAYQRQEEREEKERRRLEKFLRKEEERESKERKKREAIELKGTAYFHFLTTQYVTVLTFIIAHRQRN